MKETKVNRTAGLLLVREVYSLLRRVANDSLWIGVYSVNVRMCLGDYHLFIIKPSGKRTKQLGETDKNL